jgi:hypothetical protein
MNTKRRVTQAFYARLVASRRREKFGPGELVMLVASPEAPATLRFSRINGLRPSRGVECQYLIESDEWNLKTEAAKLTP